MKAFLKEIKFDSTNHTYIKNITDVVNEAIKKAGVKDGLALINSKHTTMGILVNEIAEPHLLEDFLHHTLASVHEDKRSTRVNKDYKHPTKEQCRSGSTPSRK